ncbi:hypothetical protein ABF86_00760 [Nitrosomonas sp. GH22]|nr:hypothetical protein [Nitrosomonas sp. GH22]
MLENNGHDRQIGVALNIEIETIAKIVSPLLVAISSFFLSRYLETRPKLISYVVHASEFPPLNENSSAVRTHGVVIRNAGKRTAHNVRIGHVVFPASYQIYPSVTHKVGHSPSGSAEIVIPTLVSNEQVTLSYLYFPPLFWNQINSYTKSDEGMAKVINVIPSPQWPQ